MHQRHIIIGRIAVLFACFGWLALIGLADAQEEAPVVVEQESEPVAGPLLESPEAEPAPPTLPPPAKPAARAAEEQSAAPAARRRPFLRPAQPQRQEAQRQRRQSAPAGLTSAEEPMPAPASAAIEVRPTPRIKYDIDRGARRMYAKSGSVDMVMVTQNPADGCYYEIPICVPACCAGEEPRMESRCGIFGRGVVEYCWPCGFEAEIKFRHILGDVKVEYDA